jgi:hypothetical protein
MGFIFMAQSHVLSALIDKRSELMGLIDVKRKELEQLNQGLVSIDGTIKLFDPDFKVSTVKARRHYQKSDLFERGELMRKVLELLRTKPMGLISLIQSVMESKGLIESQAKDIEPMIRDILSKQKHRGLLVVNDGIWSVV